MRRLNQQLPGVRIAPPPTRARGMKPQASSHKHEFRLGEYEGHGAKIRFHVCSLEGCTYRQPFDMQIVNAERLDGESEYEARSKKLS